MNTYKFVDFYSITHDRRGQYLKNRALCFVKISYFIGDTMNDKSNKLSDTVNVTMHTLTFSDKTVSYAKVKRNTAFTIESGAV